MLQLELAPIKYASKSDVIASYGYCMPLVVTWRVEHQLWEDALDLPVFLESFTKTGKLPLFTCDGCGFFGCGGYYVGIEHTERHYILNARYNPNAAETILEPIYAEMPWWQVEKVVVELGTVVAAIPRQYPYLVSYLGGTIPDLNQFDAALRVILSRI